MDIFKTVKQAVTPGQAAYFYGLSVSANGMAICPFHKDHEPSLMLYPDHFHCFACGAHGDVIDLVSGLLGIGTADAAWKIARDFGIQTTETINDRIGQFPYDPTILAKKPSKGHISDKSLLTPEQQQLKEEVRDCLFLVCDRRRQLEALAKHFAPKSSRDVPCDEYATALDLLSKNAQQFDLLLYGSDADKQAVISSVTGGEGNV